MKCSQYIKGALAVALGLFVSASYGQSLYSCGFEAAEGFTLDAPLVDPQTGLGPNGWSGGEGDQSMIVNNAAVNDSQVLKVATDGTTLTNTFGTVDISTESVYMDADVLFVPSEELTQFDVQAPGNEDLKLGLYSYKPEGAEVARLVIFHSYIDSEASVQYVNDIIGENLPADQGLVIPTNEAVKIKVTLKSYHGTDYDIAGKPPVAFSVEVNGNPVMSPLAYTDAALEEDYAGMMSDDGTMFLVANIANQNQDYLGSVSTLNVTGTGYLDNIVVDRPAAPVLPVAAIDGVEYMSLEEAIAAVPADGIQKTITLLRDVTGNGIKVQAGQNVIIDFAGFTYTVDQTVGSPGTETNGFQLLEGSTVTLKGGTLTSTTAKILVQNYCELTAIDMTFDVSENAACGYVISNNNGFFHAEGNTSITAAPGKVAFDNYFWPKNTYVDGAKVVINTTGTITGKIEMTSDGSVVPALSTLEIKAGTFRNIAWTVDSAAYPVVDGKVANINISGGSFDAPVPAEYCAAGFEPVQLENGLYGVAEKPLPPPGYAADDSVVDEGGEAHVLTEAQAAWLNSLLGDGDKAAMDAALAAGDGDGFGIEAEYLLNSNPLVKTDVSFKLDSIVVGADAKVTVSLVRTEGGLVLQSALNGTIAILSADAVDGIYGDAGALDKGAASGELAETVGTKKFFKAELR